MCSASPGIANLRTLSSVMGEVKGGGMMEAASLSADLRTLGSIIVEAEGGDQGEAEGLSVLLGLMMGGRGYQP